MSLSLMAGILPNQITGFDQLCQHIDLVFAFIVAQKRGQ